MKRLQRITEAEVIAEFLKNEFYQDNFHRDRDKFERVVLDPDLNDDLENALRRALLFRRRGHMWRELPADTQWWLVQIEPEDLGKIRVFPRAQWRKVADGSFLLSDIVKRIRANHFTGSSRTFISKIQSLSYRMRKEPDTSAVLLIGVDEQKPITILEGNHRLTAAALAAPDLAKWQFRVLAGFSENMTNSCWYETNFRTLWSYFKSRVQNFRDKEADVQRTLASRQFAPHPKLFEAASAVGDSVGSNAAMMGSAK